MSLDHVGYIESLTGTEWDDFTYEFDLNIKEEAAGINFRVKDSNNYYMWQFNSTVGKLRTHKKVNGNFVLLGENANFAIAPNTTYKVAIVTSGPIIKTFINGQLVDTTNDSTFTKGKIGFRQYLNEHAHVDNLHVYVNNPVLMTDNFGGDYSKWASGIDIALSNQELVIGNSGYIESVDGAAWNDYSFEAEVNVKDAALGVNFRVQDTNNYYMWQINTLTKQLNAHVKEAGNFRVIKSVSYPFHPNTTWIEARPQLVSMPL